MERVKSKQECHCLSVSRLRVPVDSNISKTSPQKCVEGIRALGLGQDYRYRRSRGRQQKRSTEEGYKERGYVVIWCEEQGRFG